MGAIFKTSCGVFWLIWVYPNSEKQLGLRAAVLYPIKYHKESVVSCVSYFQLTVLSAMVGFEHIQRLFTYDENNAYVTKLMMAACALTISMAAVGCCCVKLDVSNVCCAFFYLAGFLLSILAVCIILLLHLQSPQITATPHGFDIIRKVKKIVNAKGQIPRFLHVTQVQYRCCGILGFKDYRAFMLDSKYRQDVPYSCCKNQTGIAQRKCSIHNDSAPLENMFVDPSTYPINLPSKKDYHKYDEDFYGTFEEYGPAPERYLSARLKLPASTAKAANINLEGCYEHLKANTDNLHDSFSGFSVVLLCSALIMAIMYTRNCLQARRSQFTEGKQGDNDQEIDRIPGVDMLETERKDQNTQEVLNELAKPKKKLVVGEADGKRIPAGANPPSTVATAPSRQNPLNVSPGQ